MREDAQTSCSRHSRRSPQPALSADLHEAMGQLMAETIRQGRRTDQLAEAVAGFEKMLIASLAKHDRERRGSCTRRARRRRRTRATA